MQDLDNEYAHAIESSANKLHNRLLVHRAATETVTHQLDARLETLRLKNCNEKSNFDGFMSRLKSSVQKHKDLIAASKKDYKKTQH